MAPVSLKHQLLLWLIVHPLSPVQTASVPGVVGTGWQCWEAEATLHSEVRGTLLHPPMQLACLRSLKSIPSPYRSRVAIWVCLAIAEQHKPGPCSSRRSHQCSLLTPPSPASALKCLSFYPLRFKHSFCSLQQKTLVSTLHY